MATRIFTYSERIWVLLPVEAAALSGLAVLFLLCYKLYYTALRFWQRKRGRQTLDACDSSLFLTLMVGEALRAIGKLMTIPWILNATITSPSKLCTAQGMAKLIGTNIIDWCTLAISVQTFAILALQWEPPRYFTKLLVLGVWVIAGLIVGITIAVRGSGIIGPTGYWCWITSHYEREQLLSEYVWMWTAAFLSVILYTIDFLVIRGFVVIKRPFRVHWVPPDLRVRVDMLQGNNEEVKSRKKLARQLLYYPLIYCICVFPFSIVRWIGFNSRTQPPYQLFLFMTSIFSLSGLFNVILFFKTRRGLIEGGEALPRNTTGTHLPAPEDHIPEMRSTHDAENQRDIPVRYADPTHYPWLSQPQHESYNDYSPNSTSSPETPTPSSSRGGFPELEYGIHELQSRSSRGGLGSDDGNHRGSVPE